MTVINTDLPTYHRAYAWVKLVCFWAALRGDDVTWLMAGTLLYIEGFGLQGELRRTKSTGPGKKRLCRPVTISEEAFFVEREWCRVGLAPWAQANPIRQNFVLLPDEAQEGFRAEGAEPVDRVALTRNLITDYCLGPP